MKKRYVLKSKKRFIAFILVMAIVPVITTFAFSVYGYKEAACETIIVKQGDTLWDIAKKHGKNSDIRKSIYDIIKLNNLPSSEIYYGTELYIPSK